MTLHVHILPETPQTLPLWVCAQLRLIKPLTHPSVSNWLNASYSLDGKLPSGRIDAVLLQRRGWPGLTLHGAQLLVREVRARGAKLIYDIDDDLLCSHPIPAIEAALEHGRPIVKFLAYEADFIICSTDQLALRMASWPAPKSVWPNALDERLFCKPDLTRMEQAGRQVVGYAGTPSHIRDLLSVVESLRGAMAQRSDRTGLDFFGTADENILKNLFGHLLSNEPRSATDYLSYVKAMQTRVRWDVAIAPLLKCKFNTSKSDIKFLEYAMFGIPGVYSESDAYSAVANGDLGVTAQHAGFGRAVCDLLGTPERRRIIAQNAYEFVMQERTLAACARRLAVIVETATLAPTGCNGGDRNGNTPLYQKEYNRR